MVVLFGFCMKITNALFAVIERRRRRKRWSDRYEYRFFFLASVWNSTKHHGLFLFDRPQKYLNFPPDRKVNHDKRLMIVIQIFFDLHFSSISIDTLMWSETKFKSDMEWLKSLVFYFFLFKAKKKRRKLAKNIVEIHSNLQIIQFVVSFQPFFCFLSRECDR